MLTAFAPHFSILKKGLIAILLLIASEAVQAGDAAIQDEPLPPEVKKLIGMKIPTESVMRAGKYIPDFIRSGSGMLNKKIGNEIPKAELVYEEGIVASKWPVFIVSAMHSNGVLEILDARLLPEDLIVWRYENGKFKAAGKPGFIFSPSCFYVSSDGKPIFEGRIMFGLEDIDTQSNGFSTRIERAWEIDRQTGRIKSISTQGVVCAIIGE